MQTIRHTAAHAPTGDLMPAESASVDDLERIYRTDFPRMVRAARAIVNDAQLGYDAVQAGFVKALAKRDTFRGSSALSSWVWAIVINEARSMVRTSRATQTVGLDERDASVGANEVIWPRLNFAVNWRAFPNASAWCCSFATTRTCRTRRSRRCSASAAVPSEPCSSRARTPFEPFWTRLSRHDARSALQRIR